MKLPAWIKEFFTGQSSDESVVINLKRGTPQHSCAPNENSSLVMIYNGPHEQAKLLKQKIEKSVSELNHPFIINRSIKIEEEQNESQT